MSIPNNSIHLYLRHATICLSNERKINDGKKKKKTKNIETASGVVYYIDVKGKIRWPNDETIIGPDL